MREYEANYARAEREAGKQWEENSHLLSDDAVGMDYYELRTDGTIIEHTCKRAVLEDHIEDSLYFAMLDDAAAYADFHGGHCTITGFCDEERFYLTREEAEESAREARETGA